MISQDQDGDGYGAKTEDVPSNAPRKRSKKLFVGNVAKSATAEEFQGHFQQFGELKDCVLMKKRNEPEHRGFGFVQFSDPDVAETVLAQTHELHGRALNVNVAKGRTKKYFVGGLARDRTTTDSMRNYFEQFGEIEDIFVLQDRGFGFVTLVEEGDNLKPIEAKQYHEIDGKSCEVKIARPRELNPMGPGRGRGGFGGRGGGYGRGGYGGGYGGRGGFGGRGGGYGGYGGAYGGYGGGDYGGYGGQAGGGYNYQPY